MISALRSAAVAVALMAALAGCSAQDKPATASPSAPAGADCPELPAAPFGVETNGERLAGQTVPAEQQVLDRLVPGAQIEYFICRYARPNSTRPAVQMDVRVFRGQNGPAQAKTLADVEQGSTSDSYADFVTVSSSGDNGGFAWYDKPQFCMATHAGNAYVTITADPGVVKDPDKQKALRKQVPTLTAVMARMLDALG